uniref:glutathione S-transferase 1-like n=1 Tax=Styela clava TaxID=7725 RepID=UPI00193A0D0A|nr:glutathione S-transferase 1-like [Styela clava]
MPLEFYFSPTSPSCRAVWMLLEHFKGCGADYEEKVVDVQSGAHETEEYRKINVFEKVPGLKDGDFCMGESRSIAAYICRQLEDEKKQDALYPQDPKCKAKVDSYLYRDITELTKAFDYLNIGGVFFRGETNMCKEYEEDVKNYLDAVEKFLTENKFIAGNHLTVADFFAYVTTGLIYQLSENFEDMSSYPKILEWRKHISELSCHKKTYEDPMEMTRNAYRAKRGLQ